MRKFAKVAVLANYSISSINSRISHCGVDLSGCIRSAYPELVIYRVKISAIRDFALEAPVR